MSPVVARMVAEHGLDIAQIAGTGRGGRVTKKDVEVHLAGGDRRRGRARRGPRSRLRPPRRRPPPAAAVQAPTGATPAGARAPADGDEVTEHMSTIRKMIARNLRAVDRQRGARLHVLRGRHDALLGLRAAVNKDLTKTYGVKASFLPFIMRADGRGDPALAVGQRRAARR